MAVMPNRRMTDFRPPFYLRNRMLQTVLGSRRPGFKQNNPVLTRAETVLFTTSRGVKLSGAFSTTAIPNSRGMVMLLHGWEGSIDSKYVLASGKHLMARGFDLFRLNFRDHGGTSQLNEGLFYATRLTEVYDVLLQAAGIHPGQPVYLCGFSLGGNFALRIAHQFSRSPGSGVDLRHVMAISPVLNPSRATDAIDAQPRIRGYYMKKWRRALGQKQDLFPDRYDFSDIITLPTLRQMTDRLLVRDARYKGAEAYFAAYEVNKATLGGIRIPTTIVASRDDPVIPVDDFDRLTPPPHVRVIIHSHGGHNGFIKNLRGQAWYEDCMDRAFDAIRAY